MVNTKELLGSVAGLAICTALAGFTAGRMTAPKSTREIKTVETERKSSASASVETAQAAIVQTNTVTKYVDRIVRMPSGETIETKTSVTSAARRDERTVETKATKVAIAFESSKTTVDRLATFKPSQPRFSVGVNVSSGLDLKPHYGVAIGVRVLGPAWLTLGADAKSRAVVLGAALVF